MEPNGEFDASPGMIPIFPLPSTVFYPGTDLPLHIFEPRYREMTADALQGDKRIGMVLLKPGWEENYFDNPAVLSVGCVGRVERATRLDDGKFNIVLRGANRFRIVREVPGKPYRRAEVKLLGEIGDRPLGGSPGSGRHPIVAQFQKYARLLPKNREKRRGLNLDACKTLGQAVDQIAYQFDLNIGQKQALLEELDVQRRIDVVRSIIDLKIGIINLSKMQMQDGFDARRN